MFFITCLQRLQLNKDKLPDLGDVRVAGYFSTLEQAELVISRNDCDIHEDFYDYIIIEEIGEGLCRPSGKRKFYWYDKSRNGYFEISEPEGFEHYSNFALG